MTTDVGRAYCYTPYGVVRTGSNKPDYGARVRRPDPSPGVGMPGDLRDRIDYLFTKEGNKIISRVYIAARDRLGRGLFSRLRWEIDESEGRV